MIKFLTLHAKFMAVIALILGTTTLLLVSNNIRFSGKFGQTVSEIHLTELEPFLSSTLALPVFERDDVALREKLTSVVAARNILSIENPHGETPVAENAINNQALGRQLSVDGQKIRLTTPISLGGEQIATVLLPTDSLFSAHKAMVFESFLIALSTALMGALALGLFSYLITRRLAELEKIAIAVSAGDLSVRAPVSGRDEVAKVSRAFNTMLTRLRLAQEKLKFEKTQLEMAIQSVSAGVYDIRVDDSSVYRSQRLKDIVGVTELPGTRRAWRERIHPEDVGGYVKNVEQTLAGQIPDLQVEYRVRHNSGDYRWVREQGKLFSGASGETDRIVGLAIDITDQKETKIALQETREQLRALVDSLPHGIYMKDTHGRYLFANPTLAQQLGQAPEAVLGKTVESFFSAEAARESLAHDRRVIERRRPIRQDAEVEFPDGTTRHVDTTKFPVFDADGRVIAVGGMNLDVTEQRRAEKAQQESDQRLRALIKNLPFSVYMKDLDGRFRYASPHFAEYAGRELDEIHGETAGKFVALDREVLETRRPITRELEAVFNDGRSRILEVTKFPVTDSDGSLIGIAGLSIDVTERRRIERELSESQGRLLALFNNLPHPTYMKDTRGRYTMINPTFARELSCDANETRGKTVFDVLPQEAASAATALDQEVIETREPVRSEVELHDRTGDARQYDLTKFPIFDAGGKLAGLAGLRIDITEQRRAERARQETKLMQETLRIYEGLPVGICYLDTDFRFIHINECLAEINGIPVEEHLGRTIGDVIPDVAAGLEAQLRQVVSTGEPIIGGTVEATTSAQPRVKRHFQHSYYPVKSDDGRVVGLTCVVEDITVRRRLADEQLAHAQKMEMVGQLAGGIAHDFNNLLAIIRGHLEILQGQTKTDPGTAKRLQAVMRAARRGTDFTERLLAIGRRRNLHADKVRVGGLLDDMVEVLASALGANIRVGVGYEPGLWPIRIDPGRLEDAVLNIALNAGAAMPAGGRLDVHAANHEIAATEESNGLTPGKYVLLSMADTGTGIPSHIRPRILEPFFTTKRNGTGLGLSVVHGFLRQSGGALAIESDEGQGTRVRMYLPCTPAANRPAGEKRPASSRKFALVIDDEPDLLALTEKLLRQLGYGTRTAADTETALDLLARHPDTAVLVTDVILSDRLEGLALVRSARERIPSLPVILMSGHATKTDLGGLDGSTVFLRKPFGRDELADQLSRLLPRSSTTTSEQKV